MVYITASFIAVIAAIGAIASAASTPSTTDPINKIAAKFIYPTINQHYKNVEKKMLDKMVGGKIGAGSMTDIAYAYGATVLTAPLRLYPIFYGNWAHEDTQTVLAFMNGLGTSNWWNITKRYYSQKNPKSPKTYINGSVSVAQPVYDTYTRGKALSGYDIPNIIQDVIDAGEIPEDTDAIYTVLVSKDVTESFRPDLGAGNICTDYCAYHLSWRLTTGTRIFYSVTADVSGCLDSCATVNVNVSPNDAPGVDAMISALAHEITEAASDPFSDGVRAWQDGNGSENADKCAYTYGNTTVLGNGALVNVAWRGYSFLIQQNWDPVLQACAMA